MKESERAMLGVTAMMGVMSMMPMTRLMVRSRRNTMETVERDMLENRAIEGASPASESRDIKPAYVHQFPPQRFDRPPLTANPNRQKRKRTGKRQ